MRIEIFYGEKPPVLNLSDLRGAVAAVAPEVYLEFYPTTSYDSWIYQGADLPIWVKPEWEPSDGGVWSHPDVLVFYRVPDQYSRQQIRNFLLNHVAQATDEEIYRMKEGNRLVEKLLDADDAHIASLKARLMSV